MKATLRLLSPLLLAAMFLPAQPVCASELEHVVSGIPEPLLGNVRDHLNRFAIAGSAQVSAGRYDALAEDAEQRVRNALKPYGYYKPEITTSLQPVGNDNWRLRIQVDAGPPLRVSTATVRVEGDGKDNGELREWRREWPLPAGAIVNQVRWQERKKAALSIAESQGFLKARFTRSRIAVDLAKNTAALTLVLDSGAQVLFGDVVYDQDVLQPWVLENVPRFESGMPYNAELLEQFRLDLWRTGYFSDIEVREQRHLEESPPTVDLRAVLESDRRDTYQGTIGFGSDTGFRLQGLWSRHRLSSRGDRVDIGSGYREIDDEFSLRTDYRVPRRSARRQFWVASTTLRAENQDLEFKRELADESFVKLANGDVRDLNARAGRLHVRDRKDGFQQVLETIYAEFVRETFDYRPGEDAQPEILALANDPRFAGLFRNTTNTIALGIEWDWPAIRGSGFDTEGHRERAWIFTASDAWGSQRDFSQVYISSRRSYVYAEKWKLLLRAEVGYSDADVREIAGSVDGVPFSLSVTELPDTYRFKAGGGSSVRGYGFEELSNNDIGSNNIVTASAEIERRLFGNWSLAAFADIGNAFNDWDDARLQKGVGFGIRWYTIAGAVRVDFARALDVEGKPWRIHFNLGSPLL